MKIRTSFLLPLIFSTTAFALPVKKGSFVKERIPGEYIVELQSSKAFIPNKKKIAKNLYLVKSNIKSLSGVKIIGPNYRYYGQFMEGLPSDPMFEKQYHHKMIETHLAWNITQGESEVVIAVTDNEFRLQHEDLKNIWWKNVNEIPNNGIDDDGNGYIDDVIGWDFIDQDNDVVGVRQSTHGTHVSGIIAANVDNGLGGSGVAPGLKIMPLRWYGPRGEWTSALVAETYRYAVDMGAKIISTSYNVDPLVDDAVYLDAVKYARDNDVLIFNSAGNTDTEDPLRQKVEELILVCSVKSDNERNQDKKSSFSNYGDGIDICAPGDSIYSTAQSYYGDANNRYGYLQGTSMATPIAAAIAGLIWSKFPELSDEEVRTRLYESSDNIDNKNFWHRGKLGHGRVNAFKALNL